LNEIDKFLNTQQSKLLTHIGEVFSGKTTRSGTLEFVDQVLDDWSDFAAGRNLRQPDRRERTFWYALYILEEIAEFPPQRKPDPFMEMIKQNLVRVAVVLRNRGELPMEFFATRPGEEPDFGFDPSRDLDLDLDLAFDLDREISEVASSDKETFH